MKNLSTALFFAFLAIILSFPVEANESSLLKSQIEVLNKEKVTIESSLLDQKSKLEEIIGKIRSTRDLQDKSYNVFREFELQNLFKKAQTMAGKISDLNSQKTSIDRNLNDKREDLFIQFNLEINTLLKSVKKEPQNKVQTLAKLKGVLAERSLLSQYLPPKYRAQVDSISIDPNDSTDEIIEKAKILEDYKSRLAKELVDVEEKLDTLKRQTYALNEMSHLLDEEDFFTETGFLKSVSRKDSASKTDSETSSASKTVSQDKSDLAESTLVSGSNDQTPAASLNEPLSAASPVNAPNTQTTSSASNQTQTLTVGDTKSSSTNGNNSTNNPALPSQTSKSSIDTNLTDGAKGTSPIAAESATSSKNNGNLNIETKSTNQNASVESLNTVSKDSQTNESNDEGKQIKRTRGYQSGDDGKEKNITHNKDLSLENQTKLLEGERANLKRLIREIEEKYSSMKGDASRLMILKNY